MASEKLTQEQIDGFNKLYAKDLPIIGGFLRGRPGNAFGKKFRLYFKDGTRLIAIFDWCGDSDNGLDMEDPYYEDFYEFGFKAVKIEEKGTKLEFEENEFFFLNYHNFFEKFELVED